MENNHPYQIPPSLAEDQETLFFNPSTQDSWALLYHGRLRPLGNLLLQWIQACPNNFWYHIEEEMARTLETQAHTLPSDTTVGRVIIPISQNMAFVSLEIPLL